MARFYLGLGSNVGERKAHLGFALRELAKLGVLLARSPLIETEPVDCARGGKFLNACVCLDTELAPRALLDAALRLERARGRVRSDRNEPRVLDIDVLLVENRVICESGLTIPHPRMHERRFVLEPLAAIAPGIVHPVLRRTVAELLGSAA